MPADLQEASRLRVLLLGDFLQQFCSCCIALAALARYRPACGICGHLPHPSLQLILQLVELPDILSVIAHVLGLRILLGSQIRYQLLGAADQLPDVVVVRVQSHIVASCLFALLLGCLSQQLLELLTRCDSVLQGLLLLRSLCCQSLSLLHRLLSSFLLELDIDFPLLDILVQSVQGLCVIPNRVLQVVVLGLQRRDIILVLRDLRWVRESVQLLLCASKLLLGSFEIPLGVRQLVLVQCELVTRSLGGHLQFALLLLVLGEALAGDQKLVVQLSPGQVGFRGVLHGLFMHGLPLAVLVSHGLAVILGLLQLGLEVADTLLESLNLCLGLRDTAFVDLFLAHIPVILVLLQHSQVLLMPRQLILGVLEVCASGFQLLSRVIDSVVEFEVSCSGLEAGGIRVLLGIPSGLQCLVGIFERMGEVGHFLMVVVSRSSLISVVLRSAIICSVQITDVAFECGLLLLEGLDLGVLLLLQPLQLLSLLLIQVACELLLLALQSIVGLFEFEVLLSQGRGIFSGLLLQSLDVQPLRLRRLRSVLGVLEGCLLLGLQLIQLFRLKILR
mmetsp:Transcript_28106/g.72725  ORF Transcript_28106/g.72725 Transcript_28106/m.72725 type:complete len:560 (-) Transcript_28106:710-2389(-)